MARRASLIRLGAAALLAALLLTGCNARLRHASVAAGDVLLSVPSLGEKREEYRCGYYAARQLIQFYHPKLQERDIDTDSLLFSQANDTVSVLHYLKDNVEIPLTMRNGKVAGLLKNISLGDPVVVFVPAGPFDVSARGLPGATLLLHCIVVAGHSANEADLFFYSDGEGPFVINREIFEKQWARVDNLCVMRDR